MAAVLATDIFDIEMHLLLEAVFQRYGFDFREYAPRSLRRRVRDFLLQEQLKSVSSLTERLLYDPQSMSRFLQSACVGTSAMFRDPEIYFHLRQHVAPVLRTYPFLKVWHAGCSSGEEVYSMAIFLQEEGLLERTRIYATDISELALRRAPAGCIPAASLPEYAENYRQAGGKNSLYSYGTLQSRFFTLTPELLKNVVWGAHNLVSDASFNTFHLIFCRNVLIYFNSELQARVRRLLDSSLEPFGTLVLGKHEDIHQSGRFRELVAGTRIYRKVPPYGP